jgi:hypothetical protein
MRNSFVIGLDSWVIQDGNYPDFKRGEDVSFALEFYSPTELSLEEAERSQVVWLEHIDADLYRIFAKVIHVRDCEWWAIDAGVLMYREERPPRGVELGTWVSGQVRIGVDPFFYFERLSRHHSAPALIYDWAINKIEIQTAPFVLVNDRRMERDPEQLGWREIEETNAWHDGAGAEYLLHCERLDNPPRR